MYLTHEVQCPCHWMFCSACENNSDSRGPFPKFEKMTLMMLSGKLPVAVIGLAVIDNVIDNQFLVYHI